MGAHIVQYILEFTVGIFFLLARFRFFYDPSKPPGNRWLNATRHASLEHKMCYCGLTWLPLFWAWVVAIVEVSTALALITQVLEEIAILGVFVTLCVATRCTAKQKVMEQNPADYIDIVGCYLWRVEGLYLIMTVCIIMLEWLP